jgi:hypothetical protein
MLSEDIRTESTAWVKTLDVYPWSLEVEVMEKSLYIR